jgi:hypothetical protein
MSDPDAIEMELSIPLPEVRYAMLRLRAGRPIPPVVGDDVPRWIWDDLADELANRASRESARVFDRLWPRRTVGAVENDAPTTPTRRPGSSRSVCRGPPRSSGFCSRSGDPLQRPQFNSKRTKPRSPGI